MKVFTSGLRLATVFGFGLGFIGQTQAQFQCNPVEIVSDIKQAAAKANVAATEELFSAFKTLATSQRDAYMQACGTIPPDVRVERLAVYLRAKAGPKMMKFQASDLRDFHWAYLSSDIKFTPIRFVGEPANLATIELATTYYNFRPVSSYKLEPGSVILIPAPAGERTSWVTATFDIGESRAVWTGSTLSDQLLVRAAVTTKGCEIFINSEPKGATVYFNGRQWYDTTDTSAVQDAGTWEIKLQLPGHKEWRETRTLTPGESWTINAVLTE